MLNFSDGAGINKSVIDHQESFASGGLLNQSLALLGAGSQGFFC
jgi:hypothetical protein